MIQIFTLDDFQVRQIRTFKCSKYRIDFNIERNINELIFVGHYDWINFRRCDRRRSWQKTRK